MRLPAGIYLENEETFGQLKFSALRREVYVQDAEGNPTDELKERTYDLRCRQHRCMAVSYTHLKGCDQMHMEYDCLWQSAFGAQSGASPSIIFHIKVLREHCNIKCNERDFKNFSVAFFLCNYKALGVIMQ